MNKIILGVLLLVSTISFPLNAQSLSFQELQQIRIEQVINEGLRRINKFYPFIEDRTEVEFMKQLFESLQPTAVQILAPNIELVFEIRERGLVEVQKLQETTSLQFLTDYDAVLTPSWP